MRSRSNQDWAQERWRSERVRRACRGTFVLNLFGALAVMALAACGQLRGAPLTANDAQWTADAHWRQVDLDVEAIINGMAQAHGVRGR